MTRSLLAALLTLSAACANTDPYATAQRLSDAHQETPTDPPPFTLGPSEPTRAPNTPEGWSGCQEMTYYRVVAGLPARFDQVGYRESRCTNTAISRTGCCRGYWQLDIRLHLTDHRLVGPYHTCGVYSYADVDGDGSGDKQRQACAAKALYDLEGMTPWAL